ncbi:hypothetical protein HZS_1337, partial [Henneguya salminicola]
MYKIVYVNQNTCYLEINNEELKLTDVEFFIPVFRFLNPKKYSLSGANINRLINRFSIKFEKLLKTYNFIEEQRIKLNSFTFKEYEKLMKNDNFEAAFTRRFPQLIRRVDCQSTKNQTMIVNRKKLDIIFINALPNYSMISVNLEIPIAITISKLKCQIFDLLKDIPIPNKASGYILKLAGKQVFLTGEFNASTNTFDESLRLIDYIEIQNRMINDEEIILTMVENKMDLIKNNGIVTKLEPESIRKNSQIERKNVWNLENTDRLGMTFDLVETNSITFYMLKIGLFYGVTLLDKVIETNIFPFTNKNIPDLFNFEIPIKQLPINTKICIVLYGSKNKMQNEPKPKYMSPVAWINISLFDYNGYLDETPKELFLYSCPIPNLISGLHPMGTTIPSISGNIYFKIELRFELSGKNIFYPRDAQLKNTLLKQNSFTGYPCTAELSDASFFKEMSEWLSFSDLSIDQKKTLWRERYSCLKQFPNLVPKILQSMPDFSKASICKAFMFLRKAPLLNSALCLELLQVKYCHPLFRSYLVKNLEQFSDEKLELYMTQIVEGLKTENHINNDLTLFLLKRAIQNRRIANFFLWGLLADYENLEVAVRNAIIVESYCRIKPDHSNDILKQVEMMNKLKNFYETACINNVTDKINLLEFFKKYISFEAIADVFRNLSCPLDPSLYLRQLKIEKCKIMESKKKPLLLVFETDDSFAKEVRILYKYGDDLRQDILVLTCMKIIDNLCQEIDPEIKFTCYNVLNSGINEGMIHLVEDATTLGTIQAKKGYKPQILHEWYQDILKEKSNLNEEQLELGSKRFASTCAGYSVMTDYCADLFVKIRESSYLILMPFLLMVNAGLPELQSESDIYYIANALDFSLDIEEARKKFEEKFSEAYEKSWSTELNFKAHNMRI